LDTARTQIIGWPEDMNKRRKVLIATLEYEIVDWKLKIKIGGLGVMSSLMGKSMADVDLIWVIPKVNDLEYPPSDPVDPIEATIFGEPYLIEIETHLLDNITYAILDSLVFRARTKGDPYPARMNGLSSAIFYYPTWNQAIAATFRRYPDIDYTTSTVTTEPSPPSICSQRPFLSAWPFTTPSSRVCDRFARRRK